MCEISCKNSDRLLRKWHKTFGDTFFAAHCIYNNTGLISKVSEQIDSENAENCCCRQPHCHLMPLPQGISVNIRINLISPETRVTGLHFALIVWVCLHLNFCGGLRKTHLFCNRMRIGRSRSSKVTDFGTN